MGWFSFLRLRRSSEPDYETLLSGLEQRIKARESHLLSIRLRERRANALFITYGLGAWIVYVALWWFGVVRAEAGVEKVVRGLPVAGGPVVIVFTRRFIRMWYKRKQDKEEATLRTLKKQQRDKVEELKRKTGYYSTKSLLDKYDDVIKKKEEARNPPSTPIKKGSQPGPPVGPGGIPFPSTPNRSGAASVPPPGTPQQHLPLLPPAPSTPAPRTLVDKLADALLGVSAEEGTPNSKYALICGECFSHNGLMVKEEWDTIQYQCPRCGFFNGPRKATSTSTSASLEPNNPAHRRVQSMMVAPTPLREQVTEKKKEEEQLEMKEVEEIVLQDREAKEEKLRQRGTGARRKKVDEDEEEDKMDTS